MSNDQTLRPALKDTLDIFIGSHLEVTIGCAPLHALN